MEDMESVEKDKIVEVLIGGMWHAVQTGTFLLVPFDLDENNSVPGIGFRTGPSSSSRNREAIYAPLTAIEAVKTLDDARSQTPGQ
jgi:hypothetical protein